MAKLRRPIKSVGGGRVPLEGWGEQRIVDRALGGARGWGGCARSTITVLLAKQCLTNPLGTRKGLVG
jgi:hypothetical protein